MGNKAKRIISLVAAATMAASALALAACDTKPYGLKNPLSYTESNNDASSNGGFAVEKDGYVYFINGQALSDANNEYGKVQKGSLMRISKTNLESGKYDQADVVVPLLFVSGNVDSGIYIHGDYVYFATPTTDKDLDGNVLVGSLDFKRAKLDGSEVMSDYYFRTSTNSVQYRFVKGDDGDLYCMYVEDGALKSYNITKRSKEPTVLVKGAASGFIFDQDQNSDTVYYTMNVPNMFFGTDDQNNESYTQIYRVSATATVSVDASKASYTAKDGNKYSNTYDFNESFFKEKNKEAEEKKKKDDTVKIPYDLSDYTTYGYVNLGELVVDGIGSSQGEFAKPAPGKTEQFHDMTDYNAAISDAHKAEFTELNGYIYSLQSYENGGIYFTRTLVNSTDNDPKYLYYLADQTTESAEWNTVLGNNDFTVVSTNTTNASADAIYYVDNGVQTYLYVSGDKLIRESYDATAGVLNSITVSTGYTNRKLLFTKDNYLYTYLADEKSMYRIDYTAPTQDDYRENFGGEEYKDVRILEIEFNTAWYTPEFFGNVLLYNNAQTVNGTAYNYINAIDLSGSGANGMMTVAEMKALNEKYEEVTSFINGLKGDENLSSAVMTYFRTGKTNAVNELVNEYGDEALSANDLKEFNAYVERKLSDRKLVSVTQEKNDYTTKFKDENGEYYDVESYFFGLLGNNVSDEDSDAMLSAWKNTVYSVTATEEAAEGGLQWWHWVLIGVGSAIVVCGGVFLFFFLRKRSKAAMEERMRSSKPRKKIDTTDDKTIDVYADEAAEQTEEVESPAEEATEETVEDAVEEPVVEEAAETVEDAAPAEEATEEAPAEAAEEALAEDENKNE